MRSANKGKNIILKRLNSIAFMICPYFLPYRKAPSIKIATAADVPPNICKAVDITAGIIMPIRDRKIPKITDRINGFFESLLKTYFTPSNFADFFSPRNSRIVISIGTTTTDIEAADNVANRSPSPIGKAKIIKGMPKKAKLPKIELKISKNTVSFFNRRIMEIAIIMSEIKSIGMIPAIIYLKASIENIVSARFTMNKAGSAK